MTQTKANRIASFAYHFIVLALFALAGLNILALRGVYLFVALSLSLLHLFLIKRIPIRSSFFFVGALTFSLAISYCRFSSFSIIQLLMIGVLPIIAFLIGQSANSNKGVFGEITTMALGYAISVIVNLFFSLSKGSIINGNGINTYIDFQLQLEVSRTYASIDFIPCLALGASLLFLTTRKNWFLSVPLSLALIISSLAINGFVGNRSSLLVAGVLIIFSLLFFCVKASTKKRRIVSACIVGFFLLLSVLLYVILANNFLGLRDFIRQIPAISRFDDKTGSGRRGQYEVFFRDWLNYPHGGMFAANLFGISQFGILEIHNTFLQVYSIGGWLPFSLEVVLLLFWLYLVLAIKITKSNRVGVITSILFSVSFFAICLFEPMITSEPFICSLFFLCAGYLYGEWARQMGRRPLLAFGLSHHGGPALGCLELLAKAAIALVLAASSTALAVFSDYGSVFSVIALLLLVSGFSALDKADYSAPSIIKTILCLVLSTAFTIFLNIYLPTNTWMYALAKSVLSIAVFIFLRIVMVSKSEEKDGYYRLRNFFTKLARDIDGSPEENLVSEDLQTNNEGE